MNLKRVMAGMLGCLIAVSSLSVHGASNDSSQVDTEALRSEAQNDTDSLREGAPGDADFTDEGSGMAGIRLTFNEGGTVALRLTGEDGMPHRMELQMDGDETVISETVSDETGAVITRVPERRESNGAYSFCLTVPPETTVGMTVEENAGYEISSIVLTNADGREETLPGKRVDPEEAEDEFARTVYLQAGITEQVHVVFRELNGDLNEETGGIRKNTQEDIPADHSENEPEAALPDPASGESDGADAERSHRAESEAPTDPDTVRKRDNGQMPENQLSADAVSQKEAKDSLTDPVIEQYLLEHVDERYTKKDFLQVVNLMNAQQTLFSARGLPADVSLDQAMTEDIYLDHWLGSYRYIIPVYWLSEESEYYVAYLNTMQNDTHAVVRDVQFARNNTNGQRVDGCIYDGETGIVYIPVSLYREAGTDAFVPGAVQAQLLQAVAGANDGMETESSYEVLTSSKKNIEADAGMGKPGALETTVQSKPGMDPSGLHVLVNGLPLTDDYYHYDGRTGEVTIAMSSAAVASVEVKEEPAGLLKKIAGAVGAATVHAASAKNLPNVYKGLTLKLPACVREGMFLQGNVIDTMMSNGTDAFNELSSSAAGAPNVYAYEYTHGHLDYAWDEKNSDGTFRHAAGELIDLIYRGERQETDGGKTITRKLNYAALSRYTEAWWQVLNFSHDDSKPLNVYTEDGKKTGDPKVNLSALGNIPLTCSHITSPLGNMSGGIQDPDEDDLDAGAVNLRVKVRVRVFERNDEEGYAVLGILAAHHKVPAGEADNGQTGVAVFKVAIEPTTAKVSLRKQSAVPEISDKNSMYSLKDAVYTVYSDQACTKKTGEFRTDASGASNTLTLQAGIAYWYKETTAPKGFYPDRQIHSLKLDGSEAEHTELVSDTPKEAVPRMLVHKVDAQTGEAAPQGDASLEGAEFSVKHYGGSSAQGTPLHQWVFRTDEKGRVPFDSAHLVSGALVKNAKGTAVFPLGLYLIEELRAPEGYLPEGRHFSVSLLEDQDEVKWSDAGFAADGLRVGESVVRGGIKVTKQDMELHRQEAMAGGDLSGICFEVKNASKQTIMYQGAAVPPGAVVLTLVTDRDGVAATQDKALPYGTYTIQELSSDKTKKSANSSYLRSDNTLHQVQIRRDGDLSGTVIEDQIARSDLEFRKTDEQTDRGLALIPFVLEQMETGEKHVLLTDKNGRYHSAKYAHSLETNRLDDLLENYTEETVIPSGQLTDYAFGTWFGLGRQGTYAEPDDSLSALPYGTYSLTELRCEANKAYDLISDYRFTIEEDQEAFDFNNIRNRVKKCSISTTLTDDQTGDHTASLGADGLVHLTDTVICKNLTIGAHYRLKAVLMNQATGNVFTGARADETAGPAGGEVQFEAKADTMSIEVPLEAFRADDEAPKVVAFERLFAVMEDGQRGELLAAHEEIDDEAQTVQIPAIRTSASDRQTESSEGTISDHQVIIDAVTYRNLVPGRRYVLRGRLIDKERQEPVKTAGEEVSGELSFVPEEPDGTVKLELALDSRTLKGKTAVVYERLYLQAEDTNAAEDTEEDVAEDTGEDAAEDTGGDAEGTAAEDTASEILIAVHEDPQDAAQSITYPEPEKDHPDDKEPANEKKETHSDKKKDTAPKKKEQTDTPEPAGRRKAAALTGDPFRARALLLLCAGSAAGISLLMWRLMRKKRGER